jgi:plastocyanin
MAPSFVAESATAQTTPAAPAPSASAVQVTASPPAIEPGAVDPREDGLEVGFGEYAITLEADTIRPGRATFVIHNAGALTHGFEMRIEGDSSGHGGGDDQFKIETETFRSGDTIEVRANLPAGVYEIECSVANHDDLGMRAFLEVRRDAPLVAPPPAQTAGDEASIEGFAFQPATLEVTAGTTVTWTNDDPAPHTVSARDGAFGSDQLDPGDMFQTTLAQAGTFEYLCQIHPAMSGTVVVR